MELKKIKISWKFVQVNGFTLGKNFLFSINTLLLIARTKHNLLVDFLSDLTERP